SNGQLVSSHVHAFLCTGSSCRNLQPSTTYYFANAGAGSGAKGGASLTTDGSGLGPNDSANWAGASYFGTSASYWTDRGTASNTAFPASGGGIDCSSWTNSGDGNGSYLGGTLATF